MIEPSRTPAISTRPNRRIIYSACSLSNSTFEEKMAVHPVVLWAQRSNESDPTKNVVYLTIQVQDPVNTKIDLTSSNLAFSADSSDGASHYELSLDFFDEIDTENSHKHEAGNHIQFVLRKKKAQADYWPRLLKEKLKLHYIKTDFDKWVDEDEQEEQAEEDMSNMMNFGGPGGPGGPGGAGDMDFSKLLAQGAGAGGPGGDFDIGSLASQLGAGAGGPGGNFDISSLASQFGQNGAGGEDEDSSGDEAADEAK